MNTKVVAFNSIKGGVGKTTLAAQFVGYLSKFAKVGVYNSDSETALATWLSRRGEFDPQLLENITLLPTESADYVFMNDDFDYIVCDIAGGDNKIARRLLAQCADVVISPFKPSQVDIDTVIKHNAILEQVKEYNPELKSFYLFNSCNTNPKNKELADALNIFNQLSNQKEIISTVIDIPIFERIILRSLFADGLSCFDLGYKAKKSKVEIEKIIQKVLDLKGEK